MGKSFNFIAKMKKRDDVRQVIRLMVLFRIGFFVLLLAHSTISKQYLGSKLMKNQDVFVLIMIGELG